MRSITENQVKTEAMATREEAEETAASWMARQEDPSWSQADAQALAAWLAASASHRVAYYRLNAVWTQVPRVRGPRRSLIAWAAAAGIAALSFAAYFEFTRVPGQVLPAPVVATAPAPEAASAVPQELSVESAQTPTSPAPRIASAREFRTELGAMRRIPLADGSQITLDTNSRIRVALDSSMRTVELEQGQAHFRVAHDPQRPFVVVAGALRAEAVGTEFTVRRESTMLRVSVVEGTVRVAAGSGTSSLLVSAGNSARDVDGKVELQPMAAVDIERDRGWREGVLVFRETPLADAISEMNRYGTPKIVIRDSAIGSLLVGGVFRVGELESFARLLEQTFPVSVSATADRIELTHRSQP